MAEDGTPVDPVEPTAPANPTAPEGGEGNPTEPAQEPTAQATDGYRTDGGHAVPAGRRGSERRRSGAREGSAEAYEPFDVEGQQFTEAQLEGFAATAKELGLSQENAQKMLAAMVPTARQYLVDDLKAKSQEWASLSEKDPEIGGANFKANVGVANQALKQFATPEFTALLRGSGLGAHPEVVRVFYRIGKAMQQDHGVTGSASAPAGARRRYPKSNMVVDV